jgi:phosphoribosylanthranilate isomerase
MEKRTIGLEDRDFAFVMKMQKQVDGMGNVTGYVPVTYVYVGDKQIGLVTSVEIQATSSVTPDVKIVLAGGLSAEDARRMPDSTKEAVKDYARILGLVPGVKVESPFI